MRAAADRRQRTARVAHPDDIYDLALAGARFVLQRDAEDEREHRHASDAARREINTTARTLSARRTLQGLSPIWSQAASSLIRQEAISAEELDAALTDRVAGESLGQFLLRRTQVPEGIVAEALARATTAPLIQLTTDPVHGEPFRSAEEALAAPKHPVLVDELAARLLPRELAARHDMILVAAWEREGVLAMMDPADDGAVWEAQEATGLRLTRFTALASQLRLAIRRCWQPRADVDVPPSGTTREALPFATAVGVPAAVLLAVFLFIFRDALNLQHHFALIALACGIFFFSYALRYYVTTAAVIGTVLFGDRLRRQRIVSQIRATKAADPRKLSLDAIAAANTAAPAGHGARHRDYRTLRGERLDDIGAIVTAGPERIGEHRLPREQQPFVSVHLAMYNERQVVDRLLRACTSFDYDNYEVIVADDSTDPQALAILDKWSEHPRVRILHRPTRKGFKGGALQEALKRMDERTEYVMIFDADFIPPPDAVWHFLDYFGRLPGPNGENGHGYHSGALTGVANGIPTNGDRLAAVQGYQWHMLNASESWITKGIRTEFSGSYVLERAAQELFGTMKMISGSVYMIRADVLRRLGWSTSITEDWELTIRLYLAGYKVMYTPYIQAPSECVSDLRQLIRQRMRWARGHTFNVKRYFFAVMRSRQMIWREKLEFLYYAPYYLQSILFLAGTVAWVLGIFLLGQKLPQWGETLGWSLVISNVLALPLMNLAGLILEGSVRRDIVGLGSFIGLSTLLVPFQGWAALRGLLEPTEGGWDRTPKSGRITEAIGSLRLGRILPWELPRRRKISSRAAHVLVTCVAGMLAGAIVGIGALSMRAAASSGNLTEGDLVVPFIFGTLIPLAVVGYGWFKLHRRIAVCVLAAAIGLSSNVVFLAATIPANAVAGTSSTFMFRNATVFDSPNLDMEQGYTPGGAATQTPASLGNNWLATFGSDVFPPTASMSSGSATVDLYGENNVTGVITFVAAGVVDSGSSGNQTPGLPTGWQQNDLFILVLQTDDNVDSDVSGWTALFEQNNGTGSRASVFYKIAGASESTPTVTHSSGNSIITRIVAFRGVDTSNPIDAWGQAAGTVNSEITAPSVSSSVPNTMLVLTTHVGDNWSSVTWPGSFAVGYHSSTASGNDSAIGLAYLEATSGGSQAAQTITLSGSGTAGIARNAAQIALRPAIRNCTITATLKHVSGTTTTLGSGTGTFASPSSTSGTLTQITFSTTAVTFADGDRLRLEVSAPADATNCNARLHFNGASQQSKLVTATIVPEGVLGLLLLAPLLPIAIRRRWIRVPAFRGRERAR